MYSKLLLAQEVSKNQERGKANKNYAISQQTLFWKKSMTNSKPGYLDRLSCWGRGKLDKTLFKKIASGTGGQANEQTLGLETTAADREVRTSPGWEYIVSAKGVTAGVRVGLDQALHIWVDGPRVRVNWGRQAATLQGQWLRNQVAWGCLSRLAEGKCGHSEGDPTSKLHASLHLSLQIQYLAHRNNQAHKETITRTKRKN